MVSFYFLVKLAFSDQPYFIKESLDMGQGEVPDVRYRISGSLLLTIMMGVLFLGFLSHSLRQWAHYHLNRKMVISYLFFAIVPLVTTTLIFFAVIRAWFGIINTMSFDKAIDLQATELKNFVRSIQLGIRESELKADIETKIRKVIETSRNNELTSIRHQKKSLSVEIYLQTEKRPGEPRYLLPMYHSDPEKMKPGLFYMEDRPEYEKISPTWMKHRRWSGVVTENDDLFIRHFSSEEHERTQIIIIASIKIENDFLDQVKEFQAVKVTLENMDATRYYSSTGPEGKWQLKLLLQPLATRWDHLAMNWESGFYEHYGYIRFEMPSEIGETLDQAGQLPFFYIDQKRSSLRFILGICLIVILCELIAFVFGGYLVHYITRSLNLIAQGHEKIAEGNLSYRLPYIGKDQLGQMGRSFNGMVSSIESLMTQVMEKEKYHEELRIARDIQMSLLPNLKDLKWCSNIAANCIPARDVGGDYYEVVQAETGEIGVFIADVSGKGTSAAFYMAELKGVLIALRHLWNKPRRLMLDLNDILHPALSSNIFISAAYLLLDPFNKSGSLVRAGHCPAFHLNTDGEITELMPPGIAIGIAKNEVFGKILDVAQFQLQDEDKIILYTDGLDEMTFHNEMYGIERLKTVLRANAKLGVEALKETILEDVLGFLSSEIQNDDLTLVVAGLPSVRTTEEMTLSSQKVY